MAITGLHHVVIRVKDLDSAIEDYKKLGFELTRTLETPNIGKQAIFQLADNTFVELVAPLSPDSPIGKAIEKRGEGVHTIAVSVDDFNGTVGAIKDSGATVIGGDDPGAPAFVHPKATHGVLLQLQNS